MIIGETKCCTGNEDEGDDDLEAAEQFSFVRPLECHFSEEAQEQIDNLTEWGGFEEDDFLIRALRRGIGVHHSRLPTKFRKAVETLFRARYLQIVIATGELLVSIKRNMQGTRLCSASCWHMNCRTFPFSTRADAQCRIATMMIALGSTTRASGEQNYEHFDSLVLPDQRDMSFQCSSVSIWLQYWRMHA